MPRSLVGTRIRQRRRDLRLSQAALARDVEISASYLNLIEHNKRGIAGRILNAIARRLDIDPRELEQGLESPIFARLQDAATHGAENQAELARMEEFVGRFPGWASLLAQLHSDLQKNRQSLALLSDRIAHDPFLSDSMHAMLSNITAIRSTASILANNQDVPPEMQARFQKNLHTESLRLSGTAQELVSYFDASQGQDSLIGDGADHLDRFLKRRNYHLSELETGQDRETLLALASALAADAELFPQPDDQARAAGYFSTYVADACAMPEPEFLSSGKASGFSPAALAAHFKVGLEAVFRRLACLPLAADLPVFGFISSDRSGSILLRKEQHGLSLPRYSGGCPLWPLYQAFSRDGAELQNLRSPNDQQFWTCSLAYSLGEPRLDRPPSKISTMIFLPLDEAEKHRLPQAYKPVLDVGPHCRLCPKQGCDARREPSLV